MVCVQPRWPVLPAVQPTPGHVDSYGFTMWPRLTSAKLVHTGRNFRSKPLRCAWPGGTRIFQGGWVAGLGCWGGWEPLALPGEWLAPAAWLQNIMHRVPSRLQMSID